MDRLVRHRRKSFALGLGAVEDKFLGHGIFTTTEKTTHTLKYDSKSQTLQPNTKNGESQRLLRQSRRLDQAVCLFNLIESNPTAAVQQRKKWEEAYGKHLGAMTNDIDEHNSDEVGFHNFVTEGVVSYTARLLQLKMPAKHYHQR